MLFRSGGGLEEKHLTENPILVNYFLILINFDFETQRKRVFGVKILHATPTKKYV